MTRLRALFRRSAVEREMDAELRFHVEQLERKLMADGLPREEARRRARLEFGGLEQVKDDARDARMAGFFDRWGRELRAALRSLRKSPGFTLIAVATLALGIGANTEMFSLLDQAALRPLPIRQPDRLFVFHSAGVNPGMNRNSGLKLSFSYPKYKDFRDHPDLFEGVAARFDAVGSVQNGSVAERVDVELVSGNYFDVVGVAPAIGRLIEPSDDQSPMAHPVVVLGWGYWQRRFGGDPAIVGRNLVVNGMPMTVIGVSARGYQGLRRGSDEELRAPMMMKTLFTPEWPGGFKNRTWAWLNIVARLRPGVSPSQAEAAANVRYRQILEDESALLTGPYLSQRDEFKKRHLDLQPAGGGLLYTVENGRDYLLPLWGMTGVVLLIACVNVAGLAMARTASRQRELAIRLALGAGRVGVARQILLENLALVAAGGVLGIGVAAAIAGPALRLLYSPDANQIFRVVPDLRVMGFAFLVTAAAALLFALGPLWQIRKASLSDVLRAESGASAKLGQVRFRKILVVTQLAFCVWLTFAAGLFARTLANLRAVDLGFRTENLITFNLDPAIAGYKMGAANAAFEKVELALGGLPGVTSVGRSLYGALIGGINIMRLDIDGFQPSNPDDTAVYELGVSPGYMKAMGINLLAGRDFTQADYGAGRVTLVNQAFAKRFYGGANPVGRRVRSAFDRSQEMEIVGMVSDQRYFGARRDAEPFYYTPSRVGIAQSFYVRTAVSPEPLLPSVRRVVEAEAPGAPIAGLRTMNEVAERALGSEKQFATLATVFGALATLLAAIGLYGVLAYTVARRTREIGIRMAVGAGRRDVLRMILREATVLIAIGIGLGLPTAVALARLIRSELYEVQTWNPAIMTGAATLVLLVGLLAAFIPARRATHVDPMRALRWE